MAADRKAWHVVDEFEKALAEYCGAPYAVAVDSCTNALFLAFRYRWSTDQSGRVLIPAHTYVGVVQAAHNAGLEVEFIDKEWLGKYDFGVWRIVDAARWLTSGVYVPGTMTCLSFQATKHLPIGRGGAILTDDEDEADWLRRARFDGRSQDENLFEQREFQEGWHMYMTPPEAARGLWLLAGLPKHNEPQEATYPDLREKVWK